MRLIKEILIKDIIDYEISEGISILEEIKQGELFVIQDMIRLGNQCSDEDACHIFENALEKKSITDIINELITELIGKEPEQDEETIDENEFKSFGDILEDFYTQIQTVDDTLSISDFLNMSTRYMYRYADGLQKRYVHKKNVEIQNQYNNVAMFMSALAGKLKKCPQLNEDGKFKGSSAYEQLITLKSMRGGNN